MIRITYDALGVSSKAALVSFLESKLELERPSLVVNEETVIASASITDPGSDAA